MVKIEFRLLLVLLLLCALPVVLLSSYIKACVSEAVLIPASYADVLSYTAHEIVCACFNLTVRL